MPAILGKLVFFLKEIDEANTGGGDGDDEEEDDDDDDDDDFEEEDDDDNDGGEATENALDQEALDYMKQLKKTDRNLMKTYALAEVGEFGDDDDEGDLYDEEENYSSPIDEVDELSVFFAAIQQANATAPQFFGPAQASLDAESQQTCAVLLQKAHTKQQQGV